MKNELKTRAKKAHAVTSAQKCEFFSLCEREHRFS